MQIFVLTTAGRLAERSRTTRDPRAWGTDRGSNPAAVTFRRRPFSQTAISQTAVTFRMRPFSQTAISQTAVTFRRRPFSQTAVTFRRLPFSQSAIFAICNCSHNRRRQHVMPMLRRRRIRHQLSHIVRMRRPCFALRGGAAAFHMLIAGLFTNGNSPQSPSFR